MNGFNEIATIGEDDIIKSTNYIVSSYCKTRKCKFEKFYIKNELKSIIDLINEIRADYNGRNLLLFNFLNEEDSMHLFREFNYLINFRIVSFSNIELSQIKTNQALFEGHYFINHDNPFLTSSVRDSINLILNSFINSNPRVQKTESLYAQ